MTEHVHDLHYVGGENPDVYCIDIDCNKRFAPDEVMRRLSATEKLSAETAHAIWRKLDALSQEHLGYEFSLNAYAAALEGKNEKA